MSETTTSTTIPVNNRNRYRLQSRAGFTLTEVLVAAGLIGFVALVGASQIKIMRDFQKDVHTRLMDDFEVTNSYKQISRDLRGTYWSRSNLFSCPSSASILDTNSSGMVSLAAEGNSVQFVSVDFASNVGRVKNTSDTLVVTEAQRLAVGDIIMLNLATETKIAAIYSVTGVDVVNNHVKITPATLGGGAVDVNCSDKTSNRTLADLFSTDVLSNVILSRLTVVKYTYEKNNIYRQAWPRQKDKALFLSDVKNFNISSAWTRSAEGSFGSIDGYGTMRFKIDFDVSEGKNIQGAQRTYQPKSIVAEYSLNPFAMSNPYSTTGTVTEDLKYPSCLVEHEFRPGSLRMPVEEGVSAAYADTVPVKLAGSISETMAGASININFAPAAGASINCFMHDPADGVYPPAGASSRYIDTLGINGGLSIFSSGSGTDIYTCAVRGRVALTASMSYYDSRISQIKTINCTVEDIVAPTAYQFKNEGLPSCSRWGYIKLNNPINGIDANVSLGSFSYDNRSCEWNGRNDNINTGLAQNCNSGDHMGKTLKRVYLRPYFMNTKTKSGANAFASGRAYIDCN